MQCIVRLTALLLLVHVSKNASGLPSKTLPYCLASDDHSLVQWIVRLTASLPPGRVQSRPSGPHPGLHDCLQFSSDTWGLEAILDVSSSLFTTLHRYLYRYGSTPTLAESCCQSTGGRLPKGSVFHSFSDFTALATHVCSHNFMSVGNTIQHTAPSHVCGMLLPYLLKARGLTPRLVSDLPACMCSAPR